MFDGPGEVSHSRSGSGANTDHGGPQLDSGVEEVKLNSCVANPEVGNQPRNAAWCPHRPDLLTPLSLIWRLAGFLRRPTRSGQGRELLARLSRTLDGEDRPRQKLLEIHPGKQIPTIKPARKNQPPYCMDFLNLTMVA